MRLDRFGRTTKQLLNLVEELNEKRIYSISISNSIDTSTPHGEFFFTIVPGIAKHPDNKYGKNEFISISKNF
ncbi:recombinase family protein [Terribacillus sp. 179-K 1B1 HS]|uniref:recombinase family protein n=1 Tax=Terribacillus sp. 179-K 1B1 HS TaxID=3142388 RepID=UPI0039A1D766